MSADNNPRNDKINKTCTELGYCCTYAFLKLNQRATDTNKRLANKLNLSVKAIEYNKKKLKEGLTKCARASGCKLKDLPK